MKNRFSQWQDWLKQNRQVVQQFALGMAILAPFGLYYAMQSGQELLAAICSGLFTAALVLTLLAH
jgi:uncharacterized membrane protein YeiH